MVMECDKLKMNPTSIFFLAEYFCLRFYYNFYRVILRRFRTRPPSSLWSHLFFEWVNYPLRAGEVGTQQKGIFGRPILYVQFGLCRLPILRGVGFWYSLFCDRPIFHGWRVSWVLRPWASRWKWWWYVSVLMEMTNALFINHLFLTSAAILCALFITITMIPFENYSL